MFVLEWQVTHRSLCVDTRNVSRSRDFISSYYVVHVHVCVCDVMYVYAQVWVHMCLNAPGDQRLTLIVTLLAVDILFLRQGFSVNLELTVQLDSANFRSVLAPSSLLFSHTGIIDISTVCSFYIGVEDLNTWQALYQLSHLPSCTSNYALCISFWHLGYQPVLYSWAVCMCVCVFMCPIGLKSARHDLLRFGSWQNSIHYSWLVCMR